MSCTPAWTCELTMLASDVLSLNGRRHRWATASRAKELRRLGWAEARRTGNVAPHLERARIEVFLAFSTRGRRDAHNFMPTIKPLIDGFVDAGLLPDDDSRHLEGPHLHADMERRSERMFGRATTTFTFRVFDLGRLRDYAATGEGAR
ncbi:Uncharacterised protein [Actinomyces bovis]|uniref:Uncharacterized protein n=1 Tax=Actinomyces bovis TaxID=1658 RepID=A0ABY1VNT9_9ACTO|nr:hypothetical protein [Actinomyces bovis]SPT53778.1 Uncharacterised protein [Actinomyces bovis]VEG53127.1 Uncharacterised protein [Actinomyces israelii]